MPGFDKDEFWIKILSMYPEARENNFSLRINQEQINELKDIYAELYIKPENLRHYDDEKLIKKMMTGLVSIYKLDKDAVANGGGQIIELVKSVSYDGKYMYINFAKVSPVKLRRFELGKSQKQIAERMGCGISTVRNCEEYYCDLSRQPENLVYKLARALECEISEFV